MKFIESVAGDMIIKLHEPSYAMKLAKELNIMQSTSIHNVKLLIELGLIEYVESPNNRTKMVGLTEKGKKLRELLIKLKELTNGKDN